MKIGITSTGKDKDSEVDPRFGRCKYFLIFDTDSGNVEAFENPSIQQSGGAGIQAGQLIVSKGVEAVLTGNMGPNAFQVVQAAGIKVVTGVSGKISEAIEKYKNGKFEPVKDPNVGSKSGISKP
ncbi:MAG: NifB/NifX family molybdenum-iron cluster-binding protein [Candidatus Omnitrophota bacterium]|jgi:predicted Fe-Mo cluster-binding NifX family protein